MFRETLQENCPLEVWSKEKLQEKKQKSGIFFYKKMNFSTCLDENFNDIAHSSDRGFAKIFKMTPILHFPQTLFKENEKDTINISDGLSLRQTCNS